MPQAPGAGELNQRVRFLERGKDGHGRKTEEFTLRMIRDAKIQYLTGSEPVIAQRLQGVQPVIVTVRDSQAARDIATDWRLEHPRLKATYDVTSVRPGAPGFIEVMAVSIDAELTGV